LPPVPLLEALEDGSVLLTQCQVVDQVEAADEDEGTGDPERARVPPEDDSLVRLGLHIYVVRCRDDYAVLHVV